MDTPGQKTPVPLPFPAWQALSPSQAAREVHKRVAALPVPLRTAALAWLRPEAELAVELERWNDLTPRRSERVEVSSLHPLHGVPYLLKDLFDAAGVPTKAGSTFLDQVRPTPGDSAIVQHLRDLGAALAGKTHLVEFASGLTGENPHFGDCPHPRFPQRLSGGSSSGSAALVAAGVVPLAMGTDTGGSVRVPAAWCGLHGFRVTPGDELIRDAVPLSPTMDTAGWFTANPADMLASWRAIVGRANRLDEPGQQIMARRASSDVAAGVSACRVLREGVAVDSDPQARRPVATPENSPNQKTITPRGCYLPGRGILPSMDPVIDSACEQAAAQFSTRADAASEATLLSSWKDAVDAYLTIGMSEAHTYHRDWLAPFHEHYDPVIWQRFTDAGRYPAEKIAAARATLQRVRGTWAQFFATFDFLVLPSAPTSAPTKAECTTELRRGILALTAPASLGGLPCLSVPVSLPSGLSAGLQIILPVANSPVVPWILSR